jgi:WD40 repeat protein
VEVGDFLCLSRPLWLLVAYSPAIDLVSCNDATSLSGDHWLRNKGLLCYWNLTRAGSPDKILCCDGRPHRCTLAPDHAHLCFAGLQEGSVALWDTREDELLHRSVSGFGGGSSLLVRSATFSTDDCAGHLAPIVALRPLLTQQDASLTQQKSTFQIASLDQDLVLIVWTVIELKEGNLAGSKHDLGLALGARVKMMKSVVVEVKHINARSCFDFMCKPADTNEFFLALSSGNITCCRRFGELPDPCTFSSAELPDPCLCLQFSPFVSNMFVAGFESGSISLFNEESSDPVLRWSNVAPGAVISIQWSFHRPSVFIALAATGEMLVFDLLVDEQLPVQVR